MRMRFICGNCRFIAVKLFKVLLIRALTFYFNADFPTCIFMAVKSPKKGGAGSQDSRAPSRLLNKPIKQLLSHSLVGWGHICKFDLSPRALH